MWIRIRALIIEDEPLAAEYLAALLDDTYQVEVVGTATESEAGLRLCAELRPDAVFLDINLPGKDRVSLATQLTMLPQPPHVVFTTAATLIRGMSRESGHPPENHSPEPKLLIRESTGPALTNLVDQMLAQHVEAIVIAPADSKGLIPVCKKAEGAGIVVVSIDNKFDAKALEQEKVKFPFVGPNNRTGAEKIGDYLGKQLKAGDKVAIIEGIPGAFNDEMIRFMVGRTNLYPGGYYSSSWSRSSIN